MTGLGSGAPGRDTATDEAPRSGGRQLVLVVLAIGLIFRLILAYALPGLRGSGFGADLGLFNYWADVLADFGPWGFYANASYADYTPGYLYALWVIGALRDVGLGLGIDATIVDSFIKLPAILTDLALAYLVYSMATELGVTTRRALIACAVVVFNPVTWFDSVIWGQVDSFGTLFLLLGLRELWRGRSERAAFFAVVAALIKPQMAILVPIVALVVIRRALWPAGGYGDEPAPRRRGLPFEWRDIGALRILTTGAVGFLTAVVLSAPFGLTVIGIGTTAPYLDSSLLRLVFSTAAQYPYLTVNAYNWWSLFPVVGARLPGVADSAATSGGALWIPDSPIKAGEAFGAIGPLPAGLVGAALLLTVAAVVAWAVARRPDRLTILVGVCVLALAFFAVPTRVHERYLFPFFGLAAILLAFSWRWRIVYVVAAVATFLNMYVVLAVFYDNPQVSDWLGIGDALRSSAGVTVVVVLHTAAFLWGFLQLRPGARATLAAELEGGRTEPFATGPEPAPASQPSPEPQARPAPAAGALAMAYAPAGSAVDAGVPVALAADGRTTPGPRLAPAWYDRPSWTDLGPIEWLRARISETPLRPDRSATLNREPGGRLDRLDLFIVVLVVIGAFLLRGYRVDEPARMHFDEVYHARTATEFLEDWRYGLPPPQIYEWTHPHLAKYAMALGIMAFAGHDVASSSDLEVPVRDAAIEPRRPDLAGQGDRAGDRLWVATGSELIAYDLRTRAVDGRWAIPGASAVAFDETGSRILAGTDAGEVWVLDGTTMDIVRGTPDLAETVSPQLVTTLDGPITKLAAFRDGTHAAAVIGDRLDVVDLDTGEVGTGVQLSGVTGMVTVDDLKALVALPSEVADPGAAAAELAARVGGEAADWEAQLTRTDADTVTLDVELTADNQSTLQEAIDSGKLAGLAIQAVSTMAVADATGVTFLTLDGTVSSTFPLEHGAQGIALVTNIEDSNELYVTSLDDTTDDPEVVRIALSADDGPSRSPSFKLPGPGTTVVFDLASQLVEVLGTAPDGSGPTVYVVEPHGHAVFADHRLPFEPVALALDHNEDYPSDGRGSLLAFGAGGEAASLDIGSYPFAWRMPGVLMGALTAGVLFLLARVLFRRRVVGVLVATFVLLDGMFFVQSRIAMNDVYVGFFILAAYLVFAWAWLDPWRRRKVFWVALPTVGVLLGLALASKWVAAYAIGALGILVLVRSALGRVILIVGLIGVTAVLGWMALAVPAGSGGAGNLPFVIIMIGVTLAAIVVTVYHPVEWSMDEVRFAVGAPAALGILVAFGSILVGKASTTITLGPVSLTPISAGFGLVVLALVAYAAFVVGGRMGVGPLAPPPSAETRIGRPPPADPAPDGWVRLGWGFGLPAIWLGVSLLAIPLVVYVISYIPWALIEGHQLWPGVPAGHTGQTLLELTGSMYQYHNDLTAAHPASSPWWAWPLNLKPVWFYQGNFADGMAAAIYDAGNLVIWWLGVPAMVFVGYQAFRRRNLALALILIAFLAQWLSWARIDRAAFQYHYYTSLPFIVLALGYFAAEIWTGASRRTWLLARASAAVAIMGPCLLWLFRYPLCAIANVQAVNAGSQACQGNPGNLVVTPSTGAMAAILIATVLVLVWLLSGMGTSRGGRRLVSGRSLTPLLVTAGIGAAALAAASFLPDDQPLFTFNGVVPELIALAAAVPLGLVALQVLTARDAHRFVLGLVAAAAAWFVVLYPNIAALSMPATIVNAYQGLLPTYLYAFQFAVNTVDRGGAISFATPAFALLVVALVVVSGVVAYATWSWRQALAIEPEEGADAGRAGEPGAA